MQRERANLIKRIIFPFASLTSVCGLALPTKTSNPRPSLQRRHNSSSPMKKLASSQNGFSLVEVALALSIGSFCMVTLLGLIPVGLHNYQKADNQSIMTNLATSVAQDLESTSVGTAPMKSPQFQLTVPQSGGTGSPTDAPQNVYVDASGAPTSGPSDSNSVYRVSVGFVPPAAGSKAATVARIVVTYPARASAASSAWPTAYTSILQTTVSLNRN